MGFRNTAKYYDADYFSSLQSYFHLYAVVTLEARRCALYLACVLLQALVEGQTVMICKKPLGCCQFEETSVQICSALLCALRINLSDNSSLCLSTLL